MAKVSGPLHSSEARGGMGGLVFNSYRGIATVKAKTAPCQPRSAKQLAARSAAVQLARLWAANLFHAEWDAYARDHPHVDGMGSSLRSSGANWFTALGTRLLAIGSPIPPAPPQWTAPPTAVGLSLSWTAPNLTLTWVDPTGELDRIQIWRDGPRSPGTIGRLAAAKLHATVFGYDMPYSLNLTGRGAITIYMRQIDVYNGLAAPFVSADIDVT